MFPDWQWQTLSLPPRHFSWRIRGNSLHWAMQQAPLLQQPYDGLVATSMVDLSGLRGLLPVLADLPAVLYFHENQFAYPQGHSSFPGVEAQLVQIYSALCADRLMFNSDYNRRTYLAGVESLLQKLPDSLDRAVLSRLPAAEVLPVPLDESEWPKSSQPGDATTLDIAWNHRWEYDKGPALLLALLRVIVREGLPLRLRLFGQRFRNSPAEFDDIARLLGRQSRAEAWEQSPEHFLSDRSSYLSHLAQCQVVLSTADHDFQGLSVMEACAVGCTPLVPDGLAYAEYLGREFRYQRESSLEATARGIACRLMEWHGARQAGQRLPRADVGAFTINALRPHYAAAMESLLRLNDKL